MQEIENVRVVVRLKPFSNEEIEEGVENVVHVDGQLLTVTTPTEAEAPIFAPPTTPKSNRISPPKTPKTPKRSSPILDGSGNASESIALATPSRSKNEIKVKKFAFDRIYSPDATQSEVYRDVEPFVQAAVEGYNSTIFVYGQTGSGKTHTMMGPPKDYGVIPRAVRSIFDYIDSKPDTMFVVQVMYVELYLDNFVDLLDPNNSPKQRGKQLAKQKPKKIEIREDVRTKSVFLSGGDSLRTTITSVEQALALIKRGTLARSVGTTNMNAQSSRSHSILTFFIESRDNLSANAPVHMGKIHLVDLAGSERLSKSGAEGATQKGTMDINSSLSALGDVLAALSSKNYNGPIPYRNSKLTRLLQDSLGGNSKTFFVINVQTCASNHQETLMSLMYGQRAKKIKNITMLNEDVRGDSDLQHLYVEIEELRKRLTERTKEFENLRVQGATTIEENRLLKQKLDILSRLNKEEITSLESQLDDVIHVQKREVDEMGFAYLNLQTNLDEYRKEVCELKLKVIREEGEKEDLMFQYDASKRELEAVQKSLRQVEDSKSELENQLQEFAEKEETFNDRIKELENMLEEKGAPKAAASGSQESSSGDEDTASLKEALKAAKKDALDRMRESNKLKQQNQFLESKVEELKTFNDNLKDELKRERIKNENLQQMIKDAMESASQPSSQPAVIEPAPETQPVEEVEPVVAAPAKPKRKSAKSKEEDNAADAEVKEAGPKAKRQRKAVAEDDDEEKAKVAKKAKQAEKEAAKEEKQRELEEKKREKERKQREREEKKELEEKERQRLVEEKEKERQRAAEEKERQIKAAEEKERQKAAELKKKQKEQEEKEKLKAKKKAASPEATKKRKMREVEDKENIPNKSQAISADNDAEESNIIKRKVPKKANASLVASPEKKTSSKAAGVKPSGTSLQSLFKRSAFVIPKLKSDAL